MCLNHSSLNNLVRNVLCIRLIRSNNEAKKNKKLLWPSDWHQRQTETSHRGPRAQDRVLIMIRLRMDARKAGM